MIRVVTESLDDEGLDRVTFLIDTSVPLVIASLGELADPVRTALVYRAATLLAGTQEDQP